MKLSDYLSAFIQLFWINKDTARECGMTHEGKVFGLPCYMAFENEGTDEEHINTMFKCTALSIPLAWLADKLYDLSLFFMQEDQFIETPVEIIKEL